MMNDQPYLKNWLSHETLQKGAVLNFTMGDKPEKTRGISESSFPYSFSTDKENPLLKK